MRGFKRALMGRVRGSGPAVVFFCLAATAAHAAPTWEFEVIGQGTLAAEPAISGGNIAIQSGFPIRIAPDFSGGPGVYLRKSNGEVETIADENTAAPGRPGENFNFSAQGDGARPSIISGGVSFHASIGESNEEGGNITGEGIYSSVFGNAAGLVASTDTPIPRGTGNFSEFSKTPGVGFLGFTVFNGKGSDGQTGIYMGAPAGVGINAIVNETTAIPTRGGFDIGSFTDFGIAPTVSPALGGERVVFLGTGQAGGAFNGIYSARPTGFGNVEVLVDEFNEVPGSPGENFESFFSPKTEGDTTAFWGRGNAGTAGIYSYSGGGEPVAVADTNTLIPGGTGTFSRFCGNLDCSQDAAWPALDNGVVAFVGSDEDGFTGIYSNFGGELHKVIDGNDPFANMPFPILDGMPEISMFDFTPEIEYFSLFHDALDGNQLVFKMETSAGEFIVRARVKGLIPEPGTLVLFSLGLAGLCFGFARYRPMT